MFLSVYFVLSQLTRKSEAKTQAEMKAVQSKGLSILHVILYALSTILQILSKDRLQLNADTFELATEVKLYLCVLNSG